MAATQAAITVGAAYVSLGTSGAGGMLVSPEGEVMVVVAASQPTASIVGHPLGALATPVFLPFAGQVWAVSVTGAPVAVTASF